MLACLLKGNPNWNLVCNRELRRPFYHVHLLRNDAIQPSRAMFCSTICTFHYYCSNFSNGPWSWNNSEVIQKNGSEKKYERGYFRSISSGRDFQFFSAHFFSKSRTDTRVGAFDRYTLPTYGKIIEKSCNFLKIFFDTPKLASFEIFLKENDAI